MTKTAVITARVDPDLKHNAERVLQSLGLSTAQAITLFLHQVELQQGLPFAVKLPNEATRRALADAEAKRNLASFNTVEELFEDLGI
jgi:DNA-damage-inducible protein J